MKSIVYTSVLAFLLSSCALQSQTVRVNPALPRLAASEKIGSRGISVALRVVDERPNPVMGHRGTGQGSGVAIQTDANLTSDIEKHVSQALTAQGFTPILFASEESRTMTVQIRQTQYLTLPSTEKTDIRIEVVLGVLLTNGKSKYEKSYKATREQQIMITPVAKTNEEWINEAFGDALDRLCTDSALFTSLAN